MTQAYKIIERRDGTVAVEVRGGSFYDPELPLVDHQMPVRIGDVGTLCRRENVVKGDELQPMLISESRGVRGNSADIYCYHGWRGTNNDCATYAIGWRECIEISRLKRGTGWRVVFSADRKPDED